MKKFRLLGATGIFVLAFGAAFATQTNNSLDTVAYVQFPNNCQVVNISETCDTTHSNPCQVLIGSTTYQAYQAANASNPSVCVTALMRP